MTTTPYLYGRLPIKHRSFPLPLTKENEIENFIKDIEGITKIITTRTVNKYLTIERAQQYANEDYITYEAAKFRPILLEKREEFEKNYPVEYADYVRNCSLELPYGNEVERVFYRIHLLKIRKEFEERRGHFHSNIPNKKEPKKEPIKKEKSKKKSIPSTVKRLVWNKHIGEEIGKHKCMCCQATDITQMSFHCGHVVAEANGGTSTVSNLKPICQNCNSSMGTKNMNEFMETLQ